MDFDCDDFEKTLKIIVVGNGNVGKTSMTTRYAKGKYTGNYKKTIGVDFMEKSVELRDLGEAVNLMIWDTAGQEEFDALTSRYYKGAGAVIYVFSTVDRDSFDDLPRWKRKVEEECGRICQVLVQNKIDLADDAAMSRAEVEDMADYMNIRLFRSCVQDNVNVKEVFEHLCRQFLKYGGSGGSDDALNAVADITTLSELGGQSKHHHHSSSKDLHHGERRAKREISDLCESRPETPSPQRPSQQQQQQQTGSRAPNGSPFPPSVPASVASEREKQRLTDDDDDSDDDNRNAARTGDGSDSDEEGCERSRASEAESRGDKTTVRRDTAAPFSVSSTKLQRSSGSKSESRQAGKRGDGQADATNSSHLKHGALAEQDDEGNDDDDADTVDTRATNAMKSDAVKDGDGNSDSRTTNSATTLKLQPSKRRTNGKKRQSVPECLLS
ncbi:hypothetical protein PybrP1_001353 [[Pythium] brassicae (nom. inval.)]|nr:hypothetical protein PybrP1_001353 [[Pythium] brassicae (nom. inval.)]